MTTTNTNKKEFQLKKHNVSNRMGVYYDNSLELVKIKPSKHMNNCQWVVTFQEYQMKDAERFLEQVRKQMVEQNMVAKDEVVYISDYIRCHKRYNTKTFEIGFTKQ